MLDKLIKFFTSMKLTVVCLAYAMVLVFLGTIAQVDEGLYAAQAKYFKSFLVHSPFHLPLVIPGGYLVGGILLVNLMMAYVSRYQFSKQKLGLLAIHLGLVLLLLGQLGTDFFARESMMRLVEGQTKNYSESTSEYELALVDTSDAASDFVTTVPESLLNSRKNVSLKGTPFTIRSVQFWPNADLETRAVAGSVASGATQGPGANWFVIPKSKASDPEERDMPAAVVEVGSAKGPLGSWVVSAMVATPQSFMFEGKTYSLAMRPARFYYPYSIELVKFNHDLYQGTDIPMNFSSQIRLINPATGENRPVLIRMNEPLRHSGLTFYQASFDQNNPRVSILQVVKNPGWLTPYISCVLVGFGLTWQFVAHLLGFIRKRKQAATTPNLAV
jgi:hypothetical protein